MSLLPEGKENNVEVTWEDQQKINQFSTLIQKKDLLGTELKEFQQEKDYLTDVIQELELLELEDDDELGSGLEDDDIEVAKDKSTTEYNDNGKKVQYKIGDTLVYMSYSEANERAQKDNEANDAAIEGVGKQLSEIESKLQKLKTQLYAKFGDNINLERD